MLAVSLSIRAPASTMTAAKPINSALWGRRVLIAVPANVAGMPATANTAASRHCTCPARMRGTAPTAEATPTTSNEIGIA